MLKRIEQYKDRWSSYGGNSGIISISEKLSPAELKQFEIFKEYDEKFLEKISPDVAIAKWKNGAVLFEEGAYINLAFFIVKGGVNVYLQSLGKTGQDPSPIFDEPRTAIISAEFDVGAIQNLKKASPQYGSPSLPGSGSKKEIHFLSTMDFNLAKNAMMHLGEGEIFGEIGAMSGWPQSVTARTVTDCVLVQIRVAALRAMKRKSAALKNRVDKLYREHSLISQLRITPMFRNCKPVFINALKEVVELVSCEPNEVIVKEGDPADAIYLVRSGFVKLLQKFSEGEIVVSYLSKGMSIGEVELLLEGLTRWELTAVSVEYAELIKIPKVAFQSLLEISPEVEEHLWSTAVARIKEAGYSKRNIKSAEFTQVALDHGLVQANSLLVIDLDVCTQCDDCVKACADTHGGRARFIREGNKVDNLLIAKSCYHCRDPVCLVGCPTGAIHRSGAGEVVKIDDDICIGCSTCANNCPYDAIVMHETGKVWPDDMVPVGLRGINQWVASKCDLCHDTGHGPACVSNCPQACAIRVGSIEEFQGLLTGPSSKPEVSHTSITEHKKVSRVWQWGFLSAVIMGLVTYMVNMMVSEIRPDNIWGISYGIGATGFLLGCAMLGLRRRIMKFASRYRLGNTNTWLHLHLYGGGLFLLLVLMHSGFQFPTGTLNSWVWGLSLGMVITGTAGWGIQKWIPMALSGVPIHVRPDRIHEAVDEIRVRAEDILNKCDDPVKSFFQNKVMPELKAPQQRFMYFFDITGRLQSRLTDFDYLKSFLSAEEKNKLEELLQLYKSKLKIDAHYTLIGPLRWWLYAHIPISVLLLVMAGLHILSVLYY